MKNFITLFVLLVMSVVQLQAQPRSKRSIIRIQLSDNSPLAVSIDSRRYDKHGTSLTIGDLPAGRHTLEVYTYNAYRDKNGGYAKRLFSGTIRIQKGTATYYTVDARTGGIRFTTEALEDNYMGRDDDRYNDNDRDERYGDRDRYNARNGITLGQGDMNDLKTHVDDRITDTDKLKLIQSVIETRSYSTEQVKTMMSWLSFESSRLDLAKWAYKGVSDRQNYWKLESEFTFSSSKDEFSDYIRKNK